MQSSSKEKFEDTKGVISSRKIEEVQTTQWPKEKRTNNDLQNITEKNEDRGIGTPL